MKSIRQVFTTLLAGLLTVSLAVMLITPNGFSNEVYTNHNVSFSDISTSQNEIQKVIATNKLVCRYINGHKRCWHE